MPDSKHVELELLKGIGGHGSAMKSDNGLISNPTHTQMPCTHSAGLANRHAEAKGSNSAESHAPQQAVKPSISFGQRHRKRIVWKGGTCIVAIPQDDQRGVEDGPSRPMTAYEVETKLKSFERAGLTSFPYAVLGGTQSRIEYPDAEAYSLDRQAFGCVIHIPNFQEWEAYVKMLTEQKLRALGVSIGPNKKISGLPLPSQLQSYSLEGPRASSLLPASSQHSKSMSMAYPSFPLTTLNAKRASGIFVDSFGNVRAGTHIHAQSVAGPSLFFTQRRASPPKLNNWSSANQSYEWDTLCRPAYPVKSPDPSLEALQDPTLKSGPRPQSTLEGVPEGDEVKDDIRATPALMQAKEVEFAHPRPQIHRPNVSIALERGVVDDGVPLEKSNIAEAAEGGDAKAGQAVIDSDSEVQETGKGPSTLLQSRANGGLSYEHVVERTSPHPEVVNTEQPAGTPRCPETADSSVRKTSSLQSHQRGHTLKHSRASNLNVYAASFEPSTARLASALFHLEADRAIFDFTVPGAHRISYAAKIGTGPAATLPDTSDNIFGKFVRPDIVKLARASKTIPKTIPIKTTGDKRENEADRATQEWRSKDDALPAAPLHEAGEDDVTASSHLASTFHCKQPTRKSLSAAAEPFRFDGLSLSLPQHNLSLEESERSQMSTAASSQERHEHPSISKRELQDLCAHVKPSDEASGNSEMFNDFANVQASFDEIDAVMRDLNGNDGELGIERYDPQWETHGSAERSRIGSIDGLFTGPSTSEQRFANATAKVNKPSSLPQSRMHTVSTASQELPVNKLMNKDDSSSAHACSSNSDRLAHKTQARSIAASEEQIITNPITLPHEPSIHHSNSTGNLSASDWDDAYSPAEVEKLQPRLTFFDSRVNQIFENVLQQHLEPLQKSLQSVQQSIAALPPRSTSRKSVRSHCPDFVPSDADDENDSVGEFQKHPGSPKRGRNPQKVQDAVKEAVFAQQNVALTDLHASVSSAVREALADLRTPASPSNSTSAGVEEIKNLIQEVLGKRALPPAESAQNEIAMGQGEEAQDDIAQQRKVTMQMQNKALQDRISELTAKVAALENTLDEYRISSSKWRGEIDEASQEADAARRSMSALRSQAEENLRTRDLMKTKLEVIQKEMAVAAGQVADEKAKWALVDIEQRKMYELLESKYDTESKRRGILEAELREMELEVKEGMRTKILLDQTLCEKSEMGESIERLKQENATFQAKALSLELELSEAQVSAETEVKRAKGGLQAEIDAANEDIQHLRTVLEAERAKAREELAAVGTAADAARTMYDLILEESADSKNTAIQDATEAQRVTLQEQKQAFDNRLVELVSQHTRTLEHAFEDRQRSEAYLNERLSLSDSKLDHYQDKVHLLEEKLQVAKAAAQAAVAAAQSAKAAGLEGPNFAGKISPQALRESILVLQEQLYDRETRIESLELELSKVDNEAPRKLKERELETVWLRELLSVREDDLTELVNVLSYPVYNRDAVRNAAIRIRANLQMGQQEKELLTASGQQSFPTLASLSNFATPKAAQLAAAFGSWRKNSGSSVSSFSKRLIADSNGTPYRATSPTQGFFSGLMTPPRSDLRKTPQPHDSPSPERSSASSSDAAASVMFPREQALPLLDPATPPLMRRASYDSDAESGSCGIDNFSDDEGTTEDGLSNHTQERALSETLVAQ